jgi:hypothetical protein
VVLQGPEVLLNANGSITSLGNAMDVVKHHGYSLNDISTSGGGTEDPIKGGVG